MNVTTAQDAYGLATAGGTDDCPFDDGVDGCLNYILTIQDFDAHPEGSDSSNRLPEVLWSGEVHGNEQVGPTAVLEAAQLLMDAATCEAHPKREIKTKDPDAWENELARAETCRQELRDFGISDSQRKWLARLVSTRRIVIVPTANALGYFRKHREEGLVDPNRDFPYDLADPDPKSLTDPEQCMVTVAARTLNEVFREHMFQLALTFHGGMEVVAYEWGAPTWDGSDSPDDTAQSAIAGAYSRYGGSFDTSPPYKHGSMNSEVYAVRGGMEDWAYAGSWDPERVIPCKPTSFGGYPEEKTIYNNSTLRAFNMLVETSNVKIPNKNTLGTSLNLLEGQTEGNGHVARNIRLALLAADLVQPYVSFVGVNDLTLSDDIVPLVRQPFAQQNERRSCQETNTVMIPATSSKFTVEWNVGGALQVDVTQAWVAKWNDVPEDALDCSTWDITGLESYFTAGSPLGPTSGLGKFADGPSQTFSSSIDIATGYQPGDKLVVIVEAHVDSFMRQQGDNVAPQLPPQSHLVNARTDPTWNHESAGKIVQGRASWISIPLTIVIDTSEGESTVEVSKRMSEIEGWTKPKPSPSNQNTLVPGKQGYPNNPAGTPQGTVEPSSPVEKLIVFLLFFGVTAGIALGGRRYLQERSRVSRRDRVREFIQDPNAPSPGLAFKKKNGRGRAGYSDIEGNGELEMGKYTDTV